MRFRVTPKAAFYADNFKPAYADKWAVVCEHCKDVGVVFADIAPAQEAARKVMPSAKNSGHIVAVVPVIDNRVIWDSKEIMIVWQPSYDGQSSKTVVTKNEFERMFAKVEA